MRVHLVNPSDVSFGTSPITPRWAYVLATGTPAEFGEPAVHDEVLERFEPEEVAAGDVVGIGIQTLNAARGYEVGKQARARGAQVVFGGIHTSLYPDEPFERGGAHAVVQGDGDAIWSEVLKDCASGRLKRLYAAGRLEPEHFLPARWEMVPRRYMWASVHSTRGCPKHCSFCSVWRIDGQRPRQRRPEEVIEECARVRARGFRFVFLADDNFYPVTLRELNLAEKHPERLERLLALRAERFRLMDGLAKLPKDLIFLTQITIEAADDREFLEAMHRAGIRGAGIGIEATTPEGLKSVYKEFNPAGEELIRKLRTFREHEVNVFGAFMFGLPTDRAETFAATAELAQKAGIAFAQFTVLTPFPGTLEFERWEKRQQEEVEGTPLSRYWLIPRARRPRVFVGHPVMSQGEILERTMATWNRFYSFGAIWERAKCARKLRSRLLFVLASKLLAAMWARNATETKLTRRRARWSTRWLGRVCIRLSQLRPMPELAGRGALARQRSLG